ncbi:protein DYAD [Morus notabilis]|uniref:protein DYAD n=1 Tax=Morus notabilis TaxID=981085 RepID=UPI000CED7BC1|nr:protein DYAD [Morus notabilis]
MEGSSSDQFSDEAAKHGCGYRNEVMYLTRPRQRAQSPSLARHALASSAEAVEQIKVGSFYEIDHSKLPPKTPEQLYSIRVAMVSEKAGSNASLRFPSVHSLRTHFSDGNYGKPEGKKLPALDEKYVMGSGMAAEVLLRRIPCQEIAEDGNLWSFWASPALAAERNGVEDVISKKGSCWSELNFTGMVRWGKRRKIRFLNRHHEYKLGVLASTADEDDDDNEAQKEEEEVQEEKEEEVEEEYQEEKEEEVAEGVEEGQVKVEADAFGVKNCCSSKRKRPGMNSKTENLKRAKTDQKQNKKSLSRSKKKPFRNSIERWSTARYKLAEENMLKIMKAKGAVFGKSILRPALRTEARKLIGDTGLLDHLLKHMAGKVAPGGTDRFRRRHNSDGAMEYWIESADLVNIRRQAGVQDPYWTPPTGWKPGDSPTQDPVCAREIKTLKEEMVNIKKMIQELVLKKQDEEYASMREVKQLREEMVKMNKNMEELAFKKPMEAGQNSKSSVQFDHEGSLLLMKKRHMELVNRKAKVEEQLMEISDYLSEMEDQIGMLKSGKLTLSESGAPPTLLMRSTTSPSDSERSGRTEKGSQNNKSISKSGDQGGDKPESTVTEDRATRIQKLKSGFRICKPRGTFLWPNMATLTLAVVHPDDHGPLVVPTPPSISSSTTSAQPHQLFEEHQSTQCGPKPPSPVKPLASKRPVRSATLCTVSKGSSSSSSIPPPPTTPNSQIMITIKTSTSLINLNETPNDQNNDDGFCGILTHQRQQSSVTSVAAITSLVPTEKEREGAEDKENGMNYNEFEQQHQKECSSTCTSRVPQIMEEDRWLALAAHDPALNSKRG